MAGDRVAAAAATRDPVYQTLSDAASSLIRRLANGDAAGVGFAGGFTIPGADFRTGLPAGLAAVGAAGAVVAADSVVIGAFAGVANAAAIAASKLIAGAAALAAPAGSR